MLIINADDFGLNENANNAILFSFKNKFISSTTLMANTEGYEQAVQMCKENNLYDNIGLHFNLTEGEPLSGKIANQNRFCKEGKFIYKRNTVFFLTLREMKAVKEEVEAQLNRLISSGIMPTHFDSHHHVHTEIFIFLSVYKCLRKHNIKKVRIPRNLIEGNGFVIKMYKTLFVLLIKFLGFKSTKYFGHYTDDISTIGNLPVELMCHPIIVGDKVIDADDGDIFATNYKMSNYKKL